MKLTKTQKKRLAGEARKLAMECLENGPAMEHQWCGCAIGICLNRAGLWRGGEYDEESMAVAAALDALVTHEPADSEQGGLLSEATQERAWRGNPTAVVFPLLALADALEEA